MEGWSVGVLACRNEPWPGCRIKNSDLEGRTMNRRNRNRGYQQLRVWEDAIELYVLTTRVFKRTSFEMGRLVSQAYASVDSVHRNIAEGYCRKSIREYFQFLNIALSSLGKSVSSFIAYRKADQLSEQNFESLDSLAYKLENGLIKLVESLERKRDQGDWTDTFIVQESNAIYDSEAPTSD